MDFRGVLRYICNYYLPVFEEYLVVPLSGPMTFFAHDSSGADYMAEFGVADDVRIIPGYEYNSDPGRCVGEFVKSLAPKSLGIAGYAGISANFYLSLRRHLGGLEPRDFTKELNAVRMVKSPAEIALTEAAIALNEDAFRQYLQLVRPGNRELDAVDRISEAALKKGAEDLYWMASSGKIPRLGYLSEARRRKHVWQAGDYHYIVLEHSAEGGHFGETTHLISLGAPNPEYERVFAVVCKSQRAAAAQIKPGALVGKLADAAEEVLTDAGYAAPYKGESSIVTRPPAIGHSQGLDVWEFPRIVHGDETVIQPGMRFNLHPAVTLLDGAKITSCDCWISTETGGRRLSSLPYEIIVV
jgi:Xaa-Pro aminopeptidase